MANTLTLLEVADVAGRQRDANLVQLRAGDSARGIVFLFTFSDVTHPGGLEVDVDSGDCEETPISAPSDHRAQRNAILT